MIKTSINKALIQRLNSATTLARKAFGQVSTKDRNKLEDVWDIEHAYYSSALEGSNIDRKEFDALAKQAR